MASLGCIPSTQEVQAFVETQIYEQDKSGNVRPFTNEFSHEETLKDESAAAEVPAQVEGLQPDDAPQEGDKKETQLAENEDSSDFETVTSCRKCGASHPLLDMVTRNPEEHWCKSCNAVCTALRRHLQWPPEEFQKLPLQEQQQFWIEAGRTKQEGSSCFKYERTIGMF